MKPRIFFAIPCSGFYREQLKIIHKVCKRAGVIADIIEEDKPLAELWPQIAKRIKTANYFVADISSRSPNIILELGYALGVLPERKIAIFISKNIDVPSDLRGKKRCEYVGFYDFQTQLADWLQQAVGIAKQNFKRLNHKDTKFRDQFMDFKEFQKLWSTPQGCQWRLTHEGLHFSNAYFPILTTTLKLLANFEFTFTARIVSEQLGWVIKGTQDYEIPPGPPRFCIMFTVTDSGLLTPHILNLHHPHPDAIYQPFNDEARTIGLRKTKDGWFSITTRCIGDLITVTGGVGPKFEVDFRTTLPYSKYMDLENVHGQIGFRCAPSAAFNRLGEVAVIRDVRVREL